ncbi:Hypothetical predicted protein [Mytilus galloprovincialis]|uniref:Reverse transcriptase/retrotransposon-derived protein RNase H-like domain-containing protein n=1 Tax=Mytilus galloprovincialis TaxID=29158 RepID=A0A8B6HN69_MYTGA|nr:Hypothetical predicted protein [Mytilus galloprovincialis]
MSNPGITMPQPQLSRVTPSRKEKEPDIFNGSKTEWVDYIVHFEQVAAWNRWSDSEKTQQLSMCLRGPAQKILSDLTLGQLSNYTSIKSALEQRFHPRESEVAYRCEFRNLKRQKDEPVADYGYRLRRSAQKAYPALKCSDIEPTVIDQYIHGEFEAFLGSSDRIFKPEGTGNEQSDFKLQAFTCKEENSKPEGVTMKDISKLLDEKLEKLFNKDNKVPENQPQKRFEANLYQNNNDSQKRDGSRNREIRCYYWTEFKVEKSVLFEERPPYKEKVIPGQLTEKENVDSSVTKSNVINGDLQAVDNVRFNNLEIDENEVRLIDKVSIPHNSELLVKSFIDGHIDNKSGLVESTDFVKQKGLMLAKSLVDTDKKCSLLLLNMNQKTVKLNENTVVALVSDVDTLEGQNETNSLESERQVLHEHLQHLVDSTSDKLTEIEKVKLTNLIHEYSSVFAEPGKALGQTDLATHTIDTGDHAPIKIPARRIPLAKKEVVDKELETMLNDGQIEPRYYRKFIPHFSEVAAPLNRLTRKGVKFTWDEKCKNSFDQLKNALTTASILSLPKSDGNLILDTDASNVGVGAVLSQMQNDEERVIAYSSRALSSSQQNYCITKRELLAVVLFVEQFRHYLWGRRFIIRTDHAPLYWLKNFKNPQGMLAGWLSILDTYDFEIQHRASIKHQNADALSRHPKLKCPNGNCSDCSVLEPKLTESDGKVKICPISATDNDDSADVNEERALEPNWLQNWNKKDLEEYQSIDKSVGPVRQMKVDYIEKPKRDEIRHLNTEGHTLWTQWDLLEIHNGLLSRRIDNKLGQSILQLVAPNQIRDFIFKEIHENRIGGHFGRNKTLESITPGLTETVKRWC